MHKASPTDMMMKKELKDAELDKKIEALRKKNEALMKRYQEVEEDKKRAEQEGMSLHCRKGKPDDLTITINKSCSEQRVVMKRSGSGDQNPRSEQEPADPAEPAGSVFSMGRGRRRQLLITTAANNKGKRVFGERKDRNRPVSPVRMKQCGDEEQNAECETAGRVKQLQSVKRVADAQTAETSVTLTDLNQPTSPEEQLEYLRWKKEREEIDRERVARHKNSRGQWRRAWDMEKTDVMFSEKANGRADRGAQNRGGRNVRRGNSRSGDESRGRVCDGGGKSVPVVGSKAKGKDRLTGRARRWDVKEQEEHLQVYPETSLEEFLEELDALCAPEQEKVSPETEKPLKTDETISDRGSEVKSGLTSAEEVHSEVSSLKATEKKVRFSVDVVDGAHEKNSNGVSTEIKTSSPKTPSRVTNGSVEENDKQTFTQHQDDGDRLREENADVTLACAEIKPPSPDQNQGNGEKKLPELNPAAESHETEPGEASGPRSSSEERRSVCTSAEPGQNQPVELMKSCTSRGNEELIDSSLCVLGLDSGDGLPDPSASADLARENGKVV